MSVSDVHVSIGQAVGKAANALRRRHAPAILAGAAVVALAAAWPAGAEQAPAQQDPVPAAAAASPEVPGVAADAAPASPQLTAADASAWLDGFMPNAIKQADIAGAVVVVVKDGAVLVQRGYGYSDVDAGKPMDPERTLMRPGSVSKLFTWTAVMQLVEQGKLDLDADVNQYLDFTIPERDGKPVTLRNVMTHTAGFEENLKYLIGDHIKDVVPLEQFLKERVPRRIFAPGTTPAYSNWATALAGYIVQRASGLSFEEYVEKNIFGPLGMQQATFRQPLPKGWDAQMSKGYPAGSKPDKTFEIIGPAPAGGLSATASDMARFMIAHLQQGRYGEAQILKAETAQLMHDSALTILPRVNRMVLGFYEATYKGRRAIAHGGDTQWFHSDLRLFVDDGVGLFVSFNSTGKDGAAGKLRNTLADEFVDRYFPAPVAAPAAVDKATALEHARLISGNYVNSRRVETTFLSLLNLVSETKVFGNDDGSIGVAPLASPSGVPYRWREIAPFVWQQEHGTDLLVAEVKDGKVVRFGVGDYAPIMLFERPAPTKAGAWLLPTAVAAFAALLLTTLAWPVGALVRRHYRVPYALQGLDATAHRRVRIVAAATVVAWIAWLGTMAAMMMDYSLFSPKSDLWLRVLQLLSAVVYVVGPVVGVWYAWVTLRSGRSKLAKAWSVVLALALVASLWVAAVYHALGFGVRY
jgi:CubicO group peptidase (beta-lactamase class C family)